MKKLRWGILATGYIARQFAKGLKGSRAGELVAVSSRDHASAERFAQEFGANSACRSHDDLLSRSDIDAVYIASPHPFHKDAALKALAARKHVLCEKPIGMNCREATQIIDAARAAGLVAMEAFMYRCHPQTAKVLEVIRSGAIGKVKLIQAAFGFNAPFDPAGRLFAKPLGGGGILDVGGYPVSFACLIADAATSDVNVAGEVLGAVADLHETAGVDTLAIANLRFANGVLAQVSVSTQLTQRNTAKVYGDKGWLELPEPWVVARDGGEWAFDLHLESEREPQRISGYEERGLYALEADHFKALVANEPTQAPGMSALDTLRVNGLLDQWRQQIGLSYEADR